MTVLNFTNFNFRSRKRYESKEEEQEYKSYVNVALYFRIRSLYIWFVICCLFSWPTDPFVYEGRSFWLVQAWRIPTLIVAIATLILWKYSNITKKHPFIIGTIGIYLIYIVIALIMTKLPFRQNVYPFFSLFLLVVAFFLPYYYFMIRSGFVILSIISLNLIYFISDPSFLKEPYIFLTLILTFWAVVGAIWIGLITEKTVFNDFKQRREIIQQAKELETSVGKITLLSEKLKLYLPHQFVESLSKGEVSTDRGHKRKRLTIFFSDVKGFTSWTDKLDPEEVREVLDKYLSEMVAIVRKWGGTIDKFIGDSIMVFFGDPEFKSDKEHAIGCVKMAMEMQIKMEQLRNEWLDFGYLDPLHIRIGINTGFAMVGNFGSKDRLDYTVLGSSVNLASRLEGVCMPDKITLSHSTYSLIKEEIDCISRGALEIKGFSEPVKIYEVLGTKLPDNESGQ